MLTVQERVNRGIRWLDSDTRNIVPKNWRSILDVNSLQFADPNKGPLGQLFGDYLTGLKKLRIIGGGVDFGFRSEYRLKEDPKNLKLVWAKALKTESCWDFLGIHPTRVILGLRHFVTLEENNIYRVEFIRNGQVHKYPNRFNSYDSSKRFVRKLISQKRI